jgi:hypothetical protein
VGEREAAPGLSRLNRLFQIRREHEERAKSRERESIFEAFHKEHHPESLPLTAQAPTAKKEKSLNREEKTPFSRLESLSRRAPERKAGRPAGSEEPRGRDVFSKLKEISLKKSGKK